MKPIKCTSAKIKTARSKNSKKMIPKISRRVALASGTFFLAAGIFKIFLVARGGSTPDTGNAFAEFLAQLDVPFPTFFAIAVPILEVAGGAGLIANRAPRLWAAALAGDMAAAIFLVGAPGKTIPAGEHFVGGEAWRLPLEIALFLAMLGLLFLPDTDKQENEDEM
jgi:uncharacterized membrane protein YphA (DoxX/SURF4 family)